MIARAVTRRAAAERTAAPALDRAARRAFAVADELTCYFDRPVEPANVHLEARLTGRLDEAALRTAVRAVLDAEAALRVRRARAQWWRHRYFWEHTAAPAADPVRVASYADEGELGGLRSALISRSPGLEVTPPFELLLASGPDGDVLLLNAHHALLDGLSCLRLLRSVAGEYSDRAGEYSERAAQRPAPEAGRGSGLAGPGPGGSGPGGPGPGGPGPGGPGRDARREPGRRAAAFGRVTKIARRPERGPRGCRAGYGVHESSWGGLASAGALRAGGQSVNDLLIAALMITISEWNAAHGARCGLIKITMPVGGRDQAGSAGQWANRSRLTTVATRLRCLQPESALLSEVAAQTRHAKEHPGPQVGSGIAAVARAPLPVAVKRSLIRIGLRAAGTFLADTCLVSNLGVVEPLAFGAAAASDLWFSTSAHMPRGLSLGVLTCAGELRLTWRYRRALLADAAAADFAERYREVLDRLTGRCDARPAARLERL